jgi:hypothetical protein
MDINEARDSIRHGYATGWAHLGAVADWVSVLACEDRLTDADRDRMHDHLREVLGGLDRLYGEAAINSPSMTITTTTIAITSTARAARSIQASFRLNSFYHLTPLCTAATSGRRMNLSPAPR